MQTNQIYNCDCLEYMRKLPNNSVDLIFTDPPYALGSEVIIRADGKPDYKKAVDFMNKWNMPNADFWSEYFKEAHRVLKHGGHCIMFGIDRQAFLFQYYAIFNQFIEKQKIYWYFISNFPKASDLSKMIDKHFGAEREVIGENSNARKNSDLHKKENYYHEQINNNITAATTELAKKYDGYKYSIAPLKQTCEEIMIFQKPYKTGSCLHDTIEMENGNNTITCGAVNIEKNRVPIDKNKEIDSRLINDTKYKKKYNKEKDNRIVPFANSEGIEMYNSDGRFPSQTFICDGTAEILDKQSGIGKSPNSYVRNSDSGAKNVFKNTIGEKKGKFSLNFGDIGGCSKINHVIQPELQDFDLFFYCPKVSVGERNEKMEGMQKKKQNKSMHCEFDDGKNPNHETANGHPTVKPIDLCKRILSLFKTPNKQVMLDTFAGSGSLICAAIELGFDYLGCEITPEYFEIANRKITVTKEIKENGYSQTLLNQTRNLFTQA